MNGGTEEEGLLPSPSRKGHQYYRGMSKEVATNSVKRDQQLARKLQERRRTSQFPSLATAPQSTIPAPVPIPFVRQQKTAPTVQKTFQTTNLSNLSPPTSLPPLLPRSLQTIKTMQSVGATGMTGITPAQKIMTRRIGTMVSDGMNRSHINTIQRKEAKIQQLRNLVKKKPFFGKAYTVPYPDGFSLQAQKSKLSMKKKEDTDAFLTFVANMVYNTGPSTKTKSWFRKKPLEISKLKEDPIVIEIASQLAKQMTPFQQNQWSKKVAKIMGIN
jgi:hypothetical protein